MKQVTETRILMHKHYIVVEAYDLQELLMEVNDVLATGEWVVAGGVSLNKEGNGYIQALTRIPA